MTCLLFHIIGIYEIPYEILYRPRAWMWCRVVSTCPHASQASSGVIMNMLYICDTPGLSQKGLLLAKVIISFSLSDICSLHFDLFTISLFHYTFLKYLPCFDSLYCFRSIIITELSTLSNWNKEAGCHAYTIPLSSTSI